MKAFNEESEGSLHGPEKGRKKRTGIVSKKAGVSVMAGTVSEGPWKNLAVGPRSKPSKRGREKKPKNDNRHM